MGGNPFGSKIIFRVARGVEPSEGVARDVRSPIEVAAGVGQELHVAGGNVVHPRHEDHAIVTLQVAQGPTPLEHRSDRTSHVPVCHGISKDFFLLSRHLLNSFRRLAIDRILNLLNDVPQVLATGGGARVLTRSDEINGRVDRAAASVPHHQNELCPSNGASIFDASQYFPTGDIPRDSNAEDVTHSKVEDQFGGSAGINTAHHDSQGVLLHRGIDHLTTQISRQAPAGTKTSVAIPQYLDHLGRRQSLLKFPGGVDQISGLVVEVVLIPKPKQTQLDSAGWRRLSFEVPDQTEQIWIDVVAAPCIEKNLTAPGNRRERNDQGCSIQKADLIGQFDMQDISAKVRLRDPTKRTADTADENESDRDSQADQNASEEIAEHDRGDCYGEWKELRPSLAPHPPDQHRADQFESRDQQDGR